MSSGYGMVIYPPAGAPALCAGKAPDHVKETEILFREPHIAKGVFTPRLEIWGVRYHQSYETAGGGESLSGENPYPGEHNIAHNIATVSLL